MPQAGWEKQGRRSIVRAVEDLRCSSQTSLRAKEAGVRVPCGFPKRLLIQDLTGIFCPVPFRNIDDPAKLRRLLESVLLLEADLSLPVLLRHFVEEACTMVGARYGALGVLNPDRTALAQFITVGIDDVGREAIGSLPTGRGVLGLLISEPHALRLTRLTDHPLSVGFPANHPPMTSFLGVSVTSRDEVYGNLYLTEKIGWSEFTKDDEDLARALAQAAGVAIENARLHERVREVAVFEDRDRIARDLHDAVIQRLFAVGLSLQSVTRSVTDSPASRHIHNAIDELDATIRQIRSSIFELSVTEDDDGARQHILSLIQDLEPVVGFETHVTFEGPLDSTVPPEFLEHVLFTLREALSNIERHAHAAHAWITVSVADDVCSLRVVDDGGGISGSPSAEGGLGLVNLRRRAEKLSGSLSIESSPEGTTLVWTAPLTAL